MTKTELLKQLEEIPGNPEIVVSTVVFANPEIETEIIRTVYSGLHHIQLGEPNVLFLHGVSYQQKVSI